MSAQVCILASRYRGTMYIGVTSDLAKRLWEHREANGSACTSRYAVHRLVNLQEHHEVSDAIRREKLVKRWRREWKFALIEKASPHRDDLLAGAEGSGVPASAGMTDRSND